MNAQSRGIALVITLIALALVSALGLGLVLATGTERLTSANYRDSVLASNAADAAMELAMRELSSIADWTPIVAGVQRSSLVDGPPSGARRAGGFAFDLTVLTNQLTCGRTSDCSDAQIRVSTVERPWGANNPRWQPFLYGWLDTFANIPGAFPDTYVVVWIGDDAREVDGDPLTDGGGPNSEGRNAVRARAEAFAAGGTRRAIEADLVRPCNTVDGVTTCEPGIRVQSWRMRTIGAS